MVVLDDANFDNDGSSNKLPALKITAATYHTAIGVCSVSITNLNGVTEVKNYAGQQGADLYNALVSIKANTYTLTT